MFNSRHQESVMARWALVAGFCWLLTGPSIKAVTAAGTILSTGFESPNTPGALENQPGWLTAGSGTSSATVQNSIAHSGDQAVLVVRTADSDRRWAVPQSGYPTQRFIAIDWDMRVSQSSSSGGFGPFFGIEAYDADVVPRVLGSLGVDATTRDVLYQIQDTAELTETGSQINFNEWNHYRIVLDFANDTYKGFLNGMQVAMTGFADRGFGLDDFTDADIAAFAAGFDAVSQNLSASAVFDNLVIRDGLVGDYDIDGDVDSADHARWRAAFGSTVAVPGNGADGNGDGVVDAADYVVWRSQLGASLFPSSAGMGSTVVPEPASFLLAVLAIQGLAVVTGRRRHVGRPQAGGSS